jgi:hypothetical protein
VPLAAGRHTRPTVCGSAASTAAFEHNGAQVSPSQARVHPRVEHPLDLASHSVDAAWIGAGGLLVGIVTTALFGMVTETRRSNRQAAENARQRAHELALRQLELRDEHRGRLHNERRAAYAEFYRSFWRLRAAYGAVLESVREWMNRESEAPLAPGLIEFAQELSSALDEMTERLMLIELVASSQVAAAAHDARNKAMGTALTPSLLPTDEDLRRHADQRQAIDEAEMLLREAIRAELELDR